MKKNDAMKKINSYLALLLLICVLLASTLSCNNDSIETNENDTESETFMSEETDTADTDSANTSLSKLSEVLPDELDFGGLTIRYYLENLLESDLLGDPEGDVVNVAVATVNQRISDFLNVDFSVEKAVSAMEMNLTIQTLIQSGDDDCDVCVIQRWCSAGLAPLGYLTEVSSLPHLNLENPWWASAYIDAMSYNGTYWLTSDMCTNYIGGTYAIFANKRIWDDLNLPDVYGIVLDGAWTIDQMTTFAKNAWQDLNGNGQMDNEDKLGYVYCWTEDLATGLGVKYCDRDDKGVPYLSMMNEHTVDVWEKLYRLYVETPGSYYAYENNAELEIEYFRNGNALFMDRMLCYSNLLRDMKDDYYLVPTPKFDEAQENYISLNAGNGAQYGVPITAHNTEAIGAVLEALALESRRTTRPAYYDLNLGEKIARDNESKKMIDLIQDTVFVDFGYCYANAIGSGLNGGWEMLFDFFRTIGNQQENNPASLYESKKNQYEQQLADLLEAFENITK